MKNLLLVAIFFGTLFFTSCKNDESTTDPTPITTEEPLVGTWISDNVDVALGLKVALKTKKIVAVFNTNKTYKVTAYDSTGAAVNYEGNFTTTDSKNGTIRNIVLNQTAPTSVTSTGIYQVGTDKNLTYEVIQTTPAITGFTAPVADSGFGSTKYNGNKFGTYYVQKFVPSVPASEVIVGSWLSDGFNVAPGLKAVLKTKKIVAVFNSNNTYKVTATDSSNAVVEYECTFTTTAVVNSSIRNIVLNQTKPTSVTSTGIYQFTASGVLYYEVLQTTPALTGFGAPTAELGFGSTTYNTVKLGATWVQKYVKQ
ncbi:MAG: hypothetical protein HYV28_02015 [Ignavibacteriales bacterium]|nr:hypothetical protein [Ignavibacteriales bacterium]